MNVDTNGIEIAVASFGILGSVLAFYVQTNIRLKLLEDKMDRMDKLQDKQDAEYKDLTTSVIEIGRDAMERFDELKDLIHDVKLEVQNKANR